MYHWSHKSLEYSVCPLCCCHLLCPESPKQQLFLLPIHPHSPQWNALWVGSNPFTFLWLSPKWWINFPDTENCVKITNEVSVSFWEADNKRNNKWSTTGVEAITMCNRTERVPSDCLSAVNYHCNLVEGRIQPSLSVSSLSACSLPSIRRWDVVNTCQFMWDTFCPLSVTHRYRSVCCSIQTSQVVTAALCPLCAS